MAEVTKEIVHENNNSNVVGWVALLVSLIALVLAWLAYNRTGTDLEDRIRQQVNQSAQTVEENTDNDTSQ